MSKSHVVVDGSNIATEGRSLPSLKQLDEAVRAFLAEHPHDVCTVVVDATFEHRIDAAEKKMYDDALAANELLTPPAGSIGRGDKFILEIADRVNATVFSNDSFQEFHGEYEWLFDEGRLIGGKPVPGVGWVFVARTPVRGPKSRQATRAASRKRDRAATTSAGKKAKHATGPVAKPPTPPKKQAAPPAPAAAKKQAASPAPAAAKKRAPSDPVNEALPFIEFVAEHQVGAEVQAEVVEFSSHGAYVTVGVVRCYAPLKLLGDPPPRSAREVLTRGETRTFVVHAIHAARRGIDVGLPEMAGTAVAAAHQTVTDIGTDQAPAEAGASLPESEATLAPAKKAPAKRKAAAKKSPAKKSPAKKTTARKATGAKKTTARKSTAKKSTAKKTTAKKKATTKRAPAKKKAGAKKVTAKKKATAKRAPAKKAGAKKATAKKKAGAKRAPARKKAAAKKAPAKKRSTAKKAGARKKSAARKAPAKKR